MTASNRLKMPSADLFFSKNDPADPRLGELVRKDNPQLYDTVIFGWPDDEGIRMNGGRIGAAEAPDRIRKYLYRMTPPVNSDRALRFSDRGNLTPDKTLPERHAAGRTLVAGAFRGKHTVLSLGGGHDYGFSDGAGFLDSFEESKEIPIVINIDAHLDMRPTEKGFNSGTPYYRMLADFPGRFEFLEIGLQPQCNARAHWDWGLKKGAELWMADEVRSSELLAKKLSPWLAARRGRPVFLSLDIDAITSRSAPGCSQAWDRGLDSDRIFEIFTMIDSALSWRGLGIYEVSPPLDTDDRTSKLAALYAYDFLARRA